MTTYFGLKLVDLAMIAALNRPHELKAHVKGAINNGLTKNDIQEIFLQVAIYVGVPAAVDSFRLAREPGRSWIHAESDGKIRRDRACWRAAAAG